MNKLLAGLKSELSRRTPLVFGVFIFFLGAAFSFIAISHTSTSSAASLDGFKAGNIISDSVMANYNSMTVDEIQAFLTKKNPCKNTNYALYLDQSSRYTKISWHWEGDEKSGHFVCLSEEKFGEGTEIGQGETAAEIIYGAAQEYKINPQVLIVLLEKEQSLITDTYPHSNQYRSATGYGCPDTAACDSRYYGFKNQVYRAAELFRYTLDYGSILYPEKQSGVYVAYNPSPSCGSSEVYIENRATAALYRYTPYQPNATAIAAGTGMGDHCSAYGNRNFYAYFTSWFGSTQGPLGETEEIPPQDDPEITPLEFKDVPETERYKIIKPEAKKTIIETGETKSVIKEPIIRYFPQYAIKGDITYYFTEYDIEHREDMTSIGLMADDLINIQYEPISDYYLITADSAKKINLTDKKTITTVGHSISRLFRAAITIGSETYYQTDFDFQNNNSAAGIAADSLRRVYDSFVPFENPRALRLTRKVKRIDPATGEVYDTLAAGRVIEFAEKIYLNNEWYYRTRHNTENGLFYVLPASSTAEK